MQRASDWWKFTISILKETNRGSRGLSGYGGMSFALAFHPPLR